MGHIEMNNNDGTNIYDEESNEVVFRQVLAKYFNKKIINMMKGIQFGRTRDDNEEE